MGTSDYFDELEGKLGGAVRQRRHLPWYVRLHVSGRQRVLVTIVAALVVATPAVGAAAGWFSTGKPDLYHPASATSGLGKVLADGGRLLPARVSDPGGGPPWGLRLVRTTRGDTCIQVGRVENGQIGALGIDGAWDNDRQFHEIKPNDQLADICGSTDAAGNGFVNQAAYGAPASVDVPLYNSNGGSRSRCRSPYAQAPGFQLKGRKVPPAVARRFKRLDAWWSRSPVCPAGSMRTVFAGLLGPAAKSITYRTPAGTTETEQTTGGVGAYLIVFKETAASCHELSGNQGCQSGGSGDNATLQKPSPILSVTYNNGKTCQLDKTTDGCAPVGWVAPRKQHLTAADVASPIRVTMSEGKRFCQKASDIGNFNGAVPCDRRVPKGDRFLYATLPAREAVLVTVSFTAREPVTSSSDTYRWLIKAPGNNGGQGSSTQTNLRSGQRVQFSFFETLNVKGTYRGRIAFMQNTGQSRPSVLLFRNDNAGLTVGRFSFTLPPKH